jgi:hypothetical protein
MKEQAWFDLENKFRVLLPEIIQESDECYDKEESPKAKKLSIETRKTQAISARDIA